MESVFDSYRSHVSDVAGKRKRHNELTALVGTSSDDRNASARAAENAPLVTSGGVPIADLATPDRPDLAEAYERGLAVRRPGDRWVGCTRLRTLNALLRKIDLRGFERSAHQLQFHAAFTAACARVIYSGGEYAVHFASINTHNGWAHDSKEVLISTPRRFGKTFSVAIFCACLALASQQSIVIFSPGRRASRAILVRIQEFINVAGFPKSQLEYNEEQLRIRNLEGTISTVRSFPSKKSVRATPAEAHAREPTPASPASCAASCPTRIPPTHAWTLLHTPTHSYTLLHTPTHSYTPHALRGAHGRALHWSRSLFTR